MVEELGPENDNPPNLQRLVYRFTTKTTIFDIQMWVHDSSSKKDELFDYFSVRHDY